MYREYETVVLADNHSADVHRVTKDTEGQVQTAGSVYVDAREGDVLVRTANPDVYEVHNGKAWDELVSGQQDTSDQAKQDADDYFEPDDHTAAEVRKYLSRSDVSAENKTRVVEAETNGRNRQSAFPRD